MIKTGKNLKIEIDVVEEELKKIANYINELDSIYTSFNSSIKEGWDSAKAREVSNSIEQVKETLNSMKSAYENVHNNVAQYRANVQSVEDSVNISQSVN